MESTDRRTDAVDPAVTLLIVDDSPYVLKSLRRTLETVPGLDISTASDGVQAVERVDRDPPDLILMDVQMPRMNGIEATKRVKDRAPETSVVMMSVQDQDSVRAVCRASGADHYVTKSRLQRTLLPKMKEMFPELEIWV